jgi:hypothetical protein
MGVEIFLNQQADYFESDIFATRSQGAASTGVSILRLDLVLCFNALMIWNKKTCDRGPELHREGHNSGDIYNSE